MKNILKLVLIMSAFHMNAFAEDRVIQVNGVAEKSLDPNFVSLTVEVWAKASTAKQAQSLAANQFKVVKKSFEDFKIKKEDIQTENYSLNPETQWDQKTQQNKMLGFRVSQVLNVTLRNVESAGNFLDALVVERKATDSGVNVNSLTWDSDKRAQVEISALADAVRATKVKAEEIAKAAGVKIKGVSRVTHSSGGGSSPGPVRGFAKAMVADSASTEVSAGQVKVRVEVSAEYEIN